METKNFLKESAKEVARYCAAVPLLYCWVVVATVEKVGNCVFDVLDKVSDKGKRNLRNCRQK